MLIALTDATQIAKANRRLFSLLNNYRDFYDLRRIVYPHGHHEDNISYSSQLGIWWFSGKAGEKAKRYWNVFGTDDPNKLEKLRIDCEINMLLEGFSGRSAGLWAKEGKQIVLLHSGKIGGGSRGVGKALFLDNFQEDEMIEVEVNGYMRRYAMVAKLDSPHLGEQLARFAKEIYRIKNIAREELADSNSLGDYSPEFVGEKKYKLTAKEIVSNCDHGLIVDALKQELNVLGFKATNSQHIDLYTQSRRQVGKIFEVKTTLSSQSVFTAVGQLMLNSASLSGKQELYFVCPDTIDKKLVNDLQKLNINVVTFHWKKRQPCFVNLQEEL